MGKRKFRLSTRKNYERKKYQNKRKALSSTELVKIPRTICDPTELLVHVPQTIYCDATTSDPKLLYERIQSLKILPEGWVLENLLGSCSMFIMSRVFSYGRMNISVGSNCLWTIHIDDICLCLPNHSLLNFQNCRVESVNAVLQLINSALVTQMQNLLRSASRGKENFLIIQVNYNM